MHINLNTQLKQINFTELHKKIKAANTFTSIVINSIPPVDIASELTHLADYPRIHIILYTDKLYHPDAIKHFLGNKVSTYIFIADNNNRLSKVKSMSNHYKKHGINLKLKLKMG